MIALWHFYWPVFTAGLVIGLIAGWLAFYRKPRTGKARLAAGAVLSFAAASAWHGPIGTGERLAARIEAAARAELDRIELPFIAARVERAPLSRTLLLAGPADAFQRRELPRYMGAIPGVADVRWADPRSAKEPR